MLPRRHSPNLLSEERMITGEIQPNLTVFEAPDNEQASFSLPGSPHLQGFGEKSGGFFSSRLAGFQLGLFERVTE